MRGIKGLTLAVFAVAALLVAPASAFALGGFAAGGYPATAEGSLYGNSGFVFKGTHTTACSGGSFTGELEDPVSTLPLEAASDPTCESGGLEVGVEMNGCGFEFHPGTETAGIGPSGCGPVKLEVLNCGYLEVPAQAGLSATYNGWGSGSEAAVSVLIDDYQVEYTVPKGNACKAEGTYTSELRFYLNFNELTAQNSSEEAVGLSLLSGGNGDVSLSLEGESEEEAQLTAGEYPAQVSGERLHLGEGYGEITLWEGPEREISCNTAQFDGGELSEPLTGAIELTAAYSGCSSESTEVTVEMNSCHYVYSSLELGSEGYEGPAEIACSEGDAIDLHLEGACVVEVPAQTLSDSAVFVNRQFGNGHPSDWSEVLGLMSGSGVDYSVSGYFCGLVGLETGTFEDASARSEIALFGETPS